MSAVPKKKLCWNCEGNVARNIEHCPYCGVYVNFSQVEEDVNWNPSYQPSLKNDDEIPSPIYQSSSTEEELLEEEGLLSFSTLFHKLKNDFFPILFLMSGSLFFLFGIVVFLFSRNGTFTLQWQENHAYSFFFISLPLIVLGWKFLQQLEEQEK